MIDSVTAKMIETLAQIENAGGVILDDARFVAVLFGSGEQVAYGTVGLLIRRGDLKITASIDTGAIAVPV